MLLLIHEFISSHSSHQPDEDLKEKRNNGNELHVYQLKQSQLIASTLEHLIIERKALASYRKASSSRIQCSKRFQISTKARTNCLCSSKHRNTNRYSTTLQGFRELHVLLPTEEPTVFPVVLCSKEQVISANTDFVYQYLEVWSNQEEGMPRRALETESEVCLLHE